MTTHYESRFWQVLTVLTQQSRTYHHLAENKKAENGFKVWERIAKAGEPEAGRSFRRVFMCFDHLASPFLSMARIDLRELKVIVLCD